MGHPATDSRSRGADRSARGTISRQLAREWERYAAPHRDEMKAQLKPSSLFALGAFGASILSVMTFVPAARRFTGLDAPWLAFCLLAAAICSSLFAGILWERRRLRDVLLLADTTLYFALITVLMVDTTSPVRYVFGLIFGQMATDLGRRVPFTWPMFLAVGLVPTGIAIAAWPDFAVGALVLFGAMMFVYTSITTEEQRRLRRQNERLQTAFDVADRVASNSVDIAIAASVAEIGGFVHHLRNALTPVVSHLRLLSESERIAEDERFSVEAARRGADKSVEYLEKLVDLLKRRSVASTATFALDEALRQVVGGLRESARDASIELAEAPTDFDVTGNPDQLRLALENLIRNALEAGARQVQVRALLEPGAQHVAVSIADDAGGIPAEIREALLEQPVTHGKPTGHGFGLYFSRRLIELLGGRLELTSTGPNGTVFLVVLPVRARTAEAAAAKAG